MRKTLTLVVAYHEDRQRKFKAVLYKNKYKGLFFPWTMTIIVIFVWSLM